MGINMEVKVVYGVKYDSIGDERADTIYDGDFKVQHYADCYGGNWDIVGIELNSSQDSRHEEQNFNWQIIDYTVFKDDVTNELTKLGLNGDPQLHVFTYYT